MAPCPCPPGEPPRIWRMGRTWEVVRKWHLMGLDSPPSGEQPPAGSRVASAETSGMEYAMCPRRCRAPSHPQRRNGYPQRYMVTFWVHPDPILSPS